MRIVGIDVWPVSVPFRVPFEVWRGVVHSKDHVIVEVHTDCGITGIGEASPFLYYASENQQGVIAAIVNHIGPLIIGADPFDTEKLNSLFDVVIDAHYMSKAAVEMALWDIKGKKLGVPVYTLLGGKVSESVQVAALLKSAPPDQMAVEAQKKVNEGFSVLKIKIGFGPSLDIDNVTTVREAVGEHIAIRVDAEEKYDLKTSLRIGHQLEPLDIELFSQPVPRQHFRQMAQLREMLEIPLLADESIEIPADVTFSTEQRTSDHINIKVAKSGGVLKAKRMAAIAESAGMDCLIGSMVELGPGTACGAHVAISTPNAVYASELVGPELLADDVLINPPRIEGGTLGVSDQPGFGLELDFDKLQRYRTPAV